MGGLTARWAELTKEGWKSKRPTNLSNDHTYLCPGKTTKDVRSVDFFVGAEELMRYLDKLDLGKCFLGRKPYNGYLIRANVLEMVRKSTTTKGNPAKAARTPMNTVDEPNGASQFNLVLYKLTSNRILDVLDSTAAMDTVTTEAATNEPSVEVAIARNSANAVTPTNVADDPSNTTTPLHRNLANEFDEAGDAEINIVIETDNPDDFDALESEAESDDGASDSTSSLLGDEYTPDEDVGRKSEEPMFDEALLDSMGGIANVASGTIHGDILKNMGVSGWSQPVSYSPFPYLDEPYERRPIESLRKDYTQLFNGPFGPTSRALEAATTPSGALFYFVRAQLWEDIAEASNDYFEEKLDERVEGQYSKQVLREQKKPGFTRSTREDFATPVITARELCNFVGLLIARTISPNKEKIEHLWKTVSDGAIARGLFGYFMKRDRFMHISRNLHFSSNSDQRAKSDRAWKLRPVIDSLQATFQSGYKPPPVMSFDEAMLPSRSSFNRMRVYMKDKPHKWGTSTKLTHVKFLKQLHLEFI
ncbi:Hypothetical protein PHPALM_1267 [Phytophthora palmivora]|uniref:PiggyBac transposable element-derived protein domain-containing protein n=1 Tax=Phytophthora palmivora TaxID=4796 RepID=A0A2P4YSP8_9STRA|nr:Hypothetical protein PHPALM_1267 [Phytophthora palmivora]